ncbi:uncharacterized protein LOC119464843 isoform X5 [Dermacentor silvarum]|uniref:uncharacterized protein LOC119464843 isoform X5 n=1 Tax=Dermacentor silvarum TaxID=543639 RepID=UPI0021011E39|nr:uncharacterized protein LOC119464843 isoform X5 [Dermacentor silvarum]
MSLAQMCLAFALIGGLTPLADAFLRRYRCPDRCNPHPDRPVNRCLYFCLNLIPYGHYYDGTECYHLSPLGNLFDWRGYCYRGFCTRWRSHPSAAEIYCGNGTTSTSTTVRTTKRESSAVTVPDTSPSTVVSSTLNTVSDIGASSKVQTTPPTTPEMTSASDKPTEAVVSNATSNEVASSNTSQTTTTVAETEPTTASNTPNEARSSTPSLTSTSVAEPEPTDTEKPAQNYTVTTTTAAAQPVTVTDKGNATSLDENEAIRGTEVKLTDVAPS